MTIHLLDWFMWLVITFAYWHITAYSKNGDILGDLRKMIYTTILFTFTYIILFGVLDWNWISIFSTDTETQQTLNQYLL